MSVNLSNDLIQRANSVSENVKGAYIDGVYANCSKIEIESAVNILNASNKTTMSSVSNLWEVYTMDVHTKNSDDLKGYIDGLITFKYNGTEYNHEFLYRIHDIENGKDNTLITVDYRNRIPFINDVWDDIEHYFDNISILAGTKPQTV